MKGKKFLFVSNMALSGDLGVTLQNEGHVVKFYIAKGSEQDVYDGFLEKVTSWRKYIDWADIIIFDDIGFGSTADKLRKMGKLVIGGSKYTDKLEIDRNFGQRELRKAKVHILISKQFDDYDEAIEFIRTHPDRYVFKPSGKDAPEDKRFVYTAERKDGKDLLEFLSEKKSVLKTNVRCFLLQQFAEGIEIAVGAFFNGKDFIYPINVNFEHKRLFPDDLGNMTGEMGTLMFWSKPTNMFNQTLAKIKRPLKKSKYRGYVDINCIVNENGIYPLEFTTRFGYPTIQIQLEGILNKTGNWLYKLAKGEDFKLSTKSGFQVGIIVATPPFLVEGADKAAIELYRDLPVVFKKKKIPSNVHILDVKKDANGVWRLAGVSGWNLVVTGSGHTARLAREQANRHIQNIKIRDMFYRNDIGARWNKDRRLLLKWGYINP